MLFLAERKPSSRFLDSLFLPDGEPRDSTL